MAKRRSPDDILSAAARGNRPSWYNNLSERDRAWVDSLAKGLSEAGRAVVARSVAHAIINELGLEVGYKVVVDKLRELAADGRETEP